MEKNALGTTGLQLAALAVGYVRVVASAASAGASSFFIKNITALPRQKDLYQQCHMFTV